jgi:hypothetical protein
MHRGLDTLRDEANLAYILAADKHQFLQCFLNPIMEMGKGGEKQKWKSEPKEVEKQKLTFLYTRTDKEHCYLWTK